MFTTKNLLMFIGRHAITALSSIALACLVIWFVAHRIEGVVETVAKNRALTTSLEKRTELLSTIKQDAEVIGDNDKNIEHAFMRADNILEFIATLEDLALRNGVTQSFHFSTPIASDRPAPFPISTITYTNTIVGTTATISNYLKAFEKLPYFTKIDSMNITALDKTAGIRGSSSASYQATLFTKAVQ